MDKYSKNVIICWQTQFVFPRYCIFVLFVFYMFFFLLNCCSRNLLDLLTFFRIFLDFLFVCSFSLTVFIQLNCSIYLWNGLSSTIADILAIPCLLMLIVAIIFHYIKSNGHFLSLQLFRTDCNEKVSGDFKCILNGSSLI